MKSIKTVSAFGTVSFGDTILRESLRLRLKLGWVVFNFLRGAISRKRGDRDRTVGQLHVVTNKKS